MDLKQLIHIIVETTDEMITERLKDYTEHLFISIYETLIKVMEIDDKEERKNALKGAIEIIKEGKLKEIIGENKNGSSN